MKNQPLVIAGAVLAVLGGGLFVFVMAAGTGEPPSTDLLPQLQEPVETDRPSRALAVVAGLVLAAGAALIMIGMNRWRSARGHI
jgi:hypothetical protein